MTSQIKEIKKQIELLEIKVGDWISVPTISERQKVGLVIKTDSSSAENFREVAFREHDGKIRVSCYWIDRGNSAI